MVSTDRVLLRLHVEAVWGVRLPLIEQNDIELLPESALPSWKLYAAKIAGNQIYIWRPDVESAEREILLARLDAASLQPSATTPPPGISREVALHLSADPVIDLALAQQMARSLTPQDDALIETFWPEAAAHLLQDVCRPLIGVIVDGRLLSMAHSSRRTAEACELGIDTLAEARRRGYALAATVLWSASVLQEGLTPIYSAFAWNTASLALAAASGYREFARAATIE